MEKSLNNIASFILAAGMSRRMGSENKLLKVYNNKTILNHTLKNHSESNLKNINIIVGHQKDSLLSVLENFEVSVIENNNYTSGMLSSILKINENIDDNTTGVMISLADMPLVSSIDINNIIEKFFLNSEKRICIPEYKEKLGNPMIIPVKIYKNLIKNDDLLSDKGLKNLILDGGFDIVRVSASSGILKDFDTKEDFN